MNVNTHLNEETQFNSSISLSNDPIITSGLSFDYDTPPEYYDLPPPDYDESHKHTTIQYDSL